jgi:hypothetical protein
MVLDLADELAQGTIDAILRMDDGRARPQNTARTDPTTLTRPGGAAYRHSSLAMLPAGRFVRGRRFNTRCSHNVIQEEQLWR